VKSLLDKINVISSGFSPDFNGVIRGWLDVDRIDVINPSPGEGHLL
jgi:hypothetical protein